MDYFTKNKSLFWCVVALIILNGVTLASFWLRRPPARPPGGPEGMRNGHKIMEEQLQLSAEQAQQFEQLRNEHFMRSHPLQDDMHKIRLDLLDEIFTAEPNEAKIQELVADLGDKQNQFESQLIRHFQELKNSCNQQKTEELKSLLITLIESSQPRDSRHPPEGPGGGFGPGHEPPPRR